MQTLKATTANTSASSSPEVVAREVTSATQRSTSIAHQAVQTLDSPNAAGTPGKRVEQDVYLPAVPTGLMHTQGGIPEVFAASASEQSLVGEAGSAVMAEL